MQFNVCVILIISVCCASCCRIHTCGGCSDPEASNYDVAAKVDDGTCEYSYGCTDTLADNFDEWATIDNGLCVYSYGCTDTAAKNYEWWVKIDDGSCEY
ncbi:MAG: hypothetical protein R2813_12705 [Flavobacteriales bacterium]